jgi:UDP:flavonoid glycosyltransferase YjiC (YdhE family)
MAASSLLYDGPMNAQRMRLGLSGGRNWLTRDVKAAPVLLGLWSRYFRGPMPDDPVSGRICGFVWHDRHREQEHASDEIERFLDEGEPPVIFTLGSTAVHVAGRFYEAAAQACRLIGRRGLLLTGKREYAPRSLPGGPSAVRAFTYAPYSEVLHRGCATVHHGGIGTTAQALRGGRPTVIVPFAHDQFDNAARVRRLGVSETVSRRRLSGDSLAAALRRVLDDPRVVKRASLLGAQVDEDGAETAADLLERMCADGTERVQDSCKVALATGSPPRTGS